MFDIESFSKLGIPFPLFEGMPNDAREYCGLDTCSLCGSERQHCFRLGIGCAMMVDCPTCGSVNGLDANDREAALCRHCSSTVPFPSLDDDEEIMVCYGCLRSGRAAISKDTELGMVSWTQALAGVTHGIPGLNRSDFEVVPHESGWNGVRLPQEMMFELLRTPTYSTIQGDCWLFCCRQPMIFLGNWIGDDFSQHVPDDDGQGLFEEIVPDSDAKLWKVLNGDNFGSIGVYVFRCGTCGRLKAHWDMD